MMESITTKSQTVGPLAWKRESLRRLSEQSLLGMGDGWDVWAGLLYLMLGWFFGFDTRTDDSFLSWCIFLTRVIVCAVAGNLLFVAVYFLSGVSLRRFGRKTSLLQHQTLFFPVLLILTSLTIMLLSLVHVIDNPTQSLVVNLFVVLYLSGVVFIKADRLSEKNAMDSTDQIFGGTPQ
jgi:hypothetical protein